MKRLLVTFAALAIVTPPVLADDWVIETVDGIGGPGVGTSLALDEAGCPHISYGHEAEHSLKYAFRETAGWHIETADSLTGHDSSLDLDAGVPHISYGVLWDYLRHACRENGIWSADTISTRPMSGVWHSLVMDQFENPHVCYYWWGDPHSHLVYASLDSNGWHSEWVIGSTSYSYLPGISLAVDGADCRPHVSYCDCYYGRLMYAYKDESGWHVQEVEGQGGFTWWSRSSLAINRLGKPHIGYYAPGGADLRYAHKAPGGWQIVVVDTVGDVGQYVALALSNAGFPCISYYDVTEGDLKYAYEDPCGWHVEVVDSVGDVGRWCSLALDETGRPHISYCDGTNHQLKYAKGRPTWMYLSGSVQAGELKLTWNPWPGAVAYWVYGAANQTYFTPGPAPGYEHRLVVLSPLFHTWSSPNGIGDRTDNWTYMVLAVDAADQELCRSNRAGEQDFGAGTP